MHPTAVMRCLCLALGVLPIVVAGKQQKMVLSPGRCKRWHWEHNRLAIVSDLHVFDGGLQKMLLMDLGLTLITAVGRMY